MRSDLGLCPEWPLCYTTHPQQLDCPVSTLGLETTFLTLQQSRNDAAMPMLIHALESPISAVQDQAFNALLARRNSTGHDLILQRLHRLDNLNLELIRKKGYLSSKSIRDALLGFNRQVCANGCKVILWFREYGMVPTLLHILCSEQSPYEDIISDTFLELIQILSDDWRSNAHGEKTGHAELQRQQLLTMRKQVLETLRQGIADFGIKHRRMEPIQGLLLLADLNEPFLSKVLESPRHPAFAPMMNLLAKSKATNVTKHLLLASYQSLHPLKPLLAVAANRSDTSFIDQLIFMLRVQKNETITKNLRCIETISWVDDIEFIIGYRSDEEQVVMLQYFLDTRLSQDRLFEIAIFFLTMGKIESRRLAAKSMSRFSGLQVNKLLIDMLDDPDPIVQANVIKTIHHRGIPEAAGRVFKLKDSPHQVVREAIRDTFEEFSFQRYIRSYEVLDDDVRKKLGLLAYEIDPEAATILKEELLRDQRNAQSRALGIVELLSLADQVEEELSQIVGQKDSVLQIRALELLAQLPGENAQQRIHDALNDHNELVSNTAKRLLGDEKVEKLASSQGASS